MLPFLLFGGYIDGNHFVTVFPLVLGLYFTGNVAQKRWESQTDYYSNGAGDEHYRTRPYGGRRSNYPDLSVSENGDSVQYGGDSGVHRRDVGRYDPNPDI